MICQECKMSVVPDNRYHPHLHCTIWKAYHRDPAEVLASYGYERPIPVTAVYRDEVTGETIP